jgi:hypothetical protein
VERQIAFLIFEKSPQSDLNVSAYGAPVKNAYNPAQQPENIDK